MREDEQRFEELEAKLAALSSQVEGLELEKEVDPFFEDDVRRLIEDFREKEIAELEESDDADSDSEDFQDAGFISVQRTQDPSFKVHWITPESCDNLTKETARDAFIAGAAERFGTSQQVHAGDVLILLCRKPIPESGSEPTIPEKFCHYIGMASNTFTTPSSAEPDTSTESKITDKVGNYEIFVWSSCECSGEEPATVTLPSVFEASSGSATHGNYASIGDSASPDISSADGLLTSAEIRKDNATGAVDLAKGLSNTLTISTQNAGYKTALVQLSQDLSEYYLDRKTKNLSFNADKKNLNAHSFESDIFTSKSLTLSNGDCGNLETVSISGETFDIALLKESSGTLDSTYLTTAQISLGAAVSLGESVAIETYRTDTTNLGSDLGLADGSTVFLPIITDTFADQIANADTLDTATLSLLNANVTGDGENFTVSISTEITTQTANYSSGLLTHKDSAITVPGPNITFNIPDREVSIADLVDITSKTSITDHPITSVTELLADYQVSSGLDSKTIPVSASVRKVNSRFGGGLYEGSDNLSPVTVSLGNIILPVGASDPTVSINSGLQISHYKTVSNKIVDLNLDFSWDQHSAGFIDGFFSGNTSPQSRNESVTFSVSLGDLLDPSDFAVSIGDLVDLTDNKQISPYPITSLSNLRANTGTYTTDSYNIPILADLSKVLSNFEGGLYKNSTSSNVSNVSLGSIDIPSGTTDSGVPSSSDLGISASKSAASGGGVSVSLGLAWTGNSSEYSHGLFKGNTTSSNQSASDSFNITFNDLANPGNNGSAGSYIKELQNLQGSGSYNNAGGIDLNLEFESLKSQLNFIDKGFFNNEASVANGSGSWSVSIAPMTIDTFPDLGEERSSDRIVTNISGISSSIDGSHSVANESKINLTGNLDVLDYTFNKGLLTAASSSTVSGQSLGSIIVPTSTSSGPVSMYTPNGTSDKHQPNLFKTTVSLGTASSFYTKNINTFSSTSQLIDFVNGVAESVNSPSYTAVSSLNLDASNNTGTATVRKLTDISVRGVYDVINESEGTGEASYYIDYTYEDVTLTIQNGLVTGSSTGESQTFTEGPIIVPGAELRYGCDPEYGCQPDPAGEFFDSSCGSGCPPPSDLMLRYRPKNIWRYNEISDSSGTCYEEIAHYELDPDQSTKTTQGYTNGGEFRAELGNGEQVDNFYANGVLIPFDDLYFSELGAEQLCYELTVRPSTVDLYFKAHDPSQPDNFCLRLVSEHLKEAGDTTNRTQAYTNGGEMREVVSVGAGGVVTTKPIFYVDGVPRDPDAAGSSWVLGFDGAVPSVADICTEVTEINYSATGGQNTFSDTITYAETESPQKVSVTLQYNDINNATGSSYRFVDSSGVQLDPLESYVYAEGNDPYLFTLEIPQGSTGLNVYMNDQGSAGTSTWDINLTAQ